MPGVWNINNAYNVNTKRVSSKLTFEVGERFTGRVVKKGEGKDITVKLADGWQFIAELEGNVNPEALKLVKFQVDGFENGKLKLKLLQGTADEAIARDEDFQEVIEKEGLSKEDIDILKNMVKHNISLTRDNINQIRGLIQFGDKVRANEKDIDAFIQTYLQSKGISSDSSEGQATKEILTKFFNQFKNMTSDDILAFIENNLDFSEENISSFNKLFKGNLSMEQILTELNDSLNPLGISEEDMNNISFENLIKNNLLNEESESAKNILDTATALASKVYNGNDPLTKKINILDVLKTLAGSEDSELNILQKNFNGESNDLNIGKTTLSPSLIEKLDNEEIVKLIKDTIGDDIIKSDIPKTQAEKLIESSNKLKLEDLLSNIEGRQVKLTDDEFKAFTELLNNKIQRKDINQENNIQQQEISTNAVKDAVDIKQNIENSKSEDAIIKTAAGGKDEIKAEMKDKINNIKEIVKEIIAKTELKEDGHDKIMNLIKSNINDIKVFNSVSNEYYYLNIPITANSQEYPCKLIIKDNRKDGKKIDTTNAKMIVSIKTANLGEVDGYLTIKDNKIDVNLKCESEFSSTVNNNKYKLAEGLSTLGLFVNVYVSIKDKPVDLVNCRSFFNDLTISSIDIKV